MGTNPARGAHTVNIYPASGESLNGGTVNSPTTLAAGVAPLLLLCFVTGGGFWTK
jgi:hypothetical protein